MSPGPRLFRSLRSARVRRDLGLALLLSVAVLLVWAGAVRLFQDQRLQDPIIYQGDAWFTAAQVTAARRGEYLPFFPKTLPSLGAPGAASWDDFPVSEDLLYWAIGQAAFWVGTFAALNLAFALGCVLAAVSLFWVARCHGARRELALSAGLLFGLSNFLFCRTTYHLCLVYCFTVPWTLLVASWLASPRGLRPGTRRFRVAAVVAVLVAWSFVYFLYFAAQLWALAVLVHLLRAGRRARWAPALALAGMTLIAALAVNLDTIGYRITNGPNPAAMARKATDVERFALKPISLFTPPQVHRLAAMRALSAKAIEQSLVHAEQPAPYLGVLGGLCLLWLLSAGLRELALSRAGPVPRAARLDAAAPAPRPATRFQALPWAATALLLLVANSVGGFSSLLGLFGVHAMRSVNRVSVVLLALALLAAALWLSRALARTPPALLRAGLLLVCAAGLWEQIPAGSTAQSVGTNRALAASDRKLVEAAERALPSGASVFQLPVMSFPEAPPSREVAGYELFRPYFFAETLRFSHGDVKGRAGAEWKARVAALPPPQLVQALREAGFAAVYVNRKGFPDEARAVVRDLVGLGCRVLAEADAQDSVVLAL